MNRQFLHELVKKWNPQSVPNECAYNDSEEVRIREARDKGYREAVTACTKDVEALLALFPE